MSSRKKVRFSFLRSFSVFLVFVFVSFLGLGMHPANNAMAASNTGLVVIDPGHDYFDSGAVAFGTKESVINAQLGYKVASILKSRGFEVYLTHPITYADGVGTDIEAILPKITDRKYPILESEGGSLSLCGAINSKDPDLAVSIHHNSAASSTAQGVEVFWRSSGTPSSIHQKSEHLANFAYNNCKNIYTSATRTGNPHDNTYKVCLNNSPTILFEAGYMTTRSEFDIITNSGHQQRMANAMADSIGEYMKKYPSKHNVPATVQNIQIAKCDEENSNVTVIASGVRSQNGISGVKFPTFVPNNPDPIWKYGTQIGDDTWAYSYDGSSNPGTYRTHVYATDNNGFTSPLGAADDVNVSSQATNKFALLGIKNVPSKSKFTVVAQGVNHPSGVNKVLFPTFYPNSNDPVWNTSVQTGDNNFALAYDGSKYTSDSSSEFRVHAYAYYNDSPDTPNPLGEVKINLGQSEPVNASISPNAEQTEYTITTSNVDPAAKEVMIPVWNREDQSDLYWYKATKVSYTTWVATVKIENHKLAGNYNAHVYVTDENDKQKWVYGTTFKVDPITADNFEAQVIDEAGGVFKAKLTGIHTPASVTEVKMPVWVKEDQSDLVWYDATRQEDGSYRADISYANQGYNIGTYNVHAYVTDNRGIQNNVGHTTVYIDPSKAKLSIDITPSSNQSEYTVTIKNVDAKVNNVLVPAWSKEDQSDLCWYEATKTSYSTWTAVIKTNNHKNSGTYNAHVYTCKDGSGPECVYTGKFNVDPITADSFETEMTDEASGVFRAKLTGIHTPASVTKVKMPVWVKEDQSDLVWYDATRQADGSYTADVSYANHGYTIGTYNVHAYVTDSRGIQTGVGTSKIYVDPTQAKLSVDISPNSDQTEYTVTVKNVDKNVTEVLTAVWSEEHGQADLRWYECKKVSESNWQTVVPIKNHKAAGTYNVHVYGVTDGSKKFLTHTTFDVQNITADTVATQNLDELTGHFQVKIDYINTPADVTNVKIPVWCKDDQSDIYWYTAEKQNDGSWIANVTPKKHNYSKGLYKAHAYVTDERDITANVGATTILVDKFTPTVEIEANQNSDQTEFNIDISNVSPTITNVQVPVWSDASRQQDIVWYNASIVSQSESLNNWRATAVISNHKNVGKYNAHVYGYESGTQKGLGTTTFNVDSLTANSVATQNLDQSTGNFQVRVSGINTPANVTKVEIPVWCYGSTVDVAWYAASRQSDGSWVASVSPSNHGYHTGVYAIHAYVTDARGITSNVGATSIRIDKTSEFTPIMQGTSTSVGQMVRYYNDKSPIDFPQFYQDRGVSLEDFCRTYYDSAISEGVNPEITFCQAMLETGWLKFGGDVKIEQYNFGGIGATGGGNPGNSFSSVAEGALAQIQHLKAYATSDPLNNDCVDPRYKYVEKGCAQYVEWLGQQENPNGKGWATGKDYGYKIMDLVRALLKN